MSAVTPSPMPTPDLAGLLRRSPNKSVTEPAPAISLSPPRSSRNIRTGAANVAAVPLAVEPQSVGPVQRQYLRSITVYLPRSVHQRLHTHAVTRGTTATAAILHAINSTHEQLAAGLLKAQPDKARQDLFDIPQVQASEPAVQTTIRVTDRQYDVLAELTATHGINRSRLITTALVIYLD